ncbi:Lrp/AsnC family transcriptional regulator [Pseudoruegeria sp. SHC-113]|uniref:Lrp/AsnC family transcriptional regulator n=1 Tax=Pseudoruegeria sp. SHC-113 TaxID=2855439 RepID=UPI0021BB17A8|nr:Lrp/AsnC family transcriptional regulator [Pseudoruegeria sp. SHC-113]MCT8159468.1 Lrp/AsnC family transcriptional regulator [Pseudoruegeria sp. SHC-113]
MTNSAPTWFRDALDRRIIAELQRNARQSTSTLAARLGVPRSTVHERISRLEREGVIAGYSVVLAQAPGSKGIQALVLIEVKQPETRKIIQRLSQYTEARVCLSINGEFDLFLQLEAPGIEDLDAIVDEIGEMPGVLRTKTSIVFGSRFDRRYDETAQRITEQFGIASDDLP